MRPTWAFHTWVPHVGPTQRSIVWVLMGYKLSVRVVSGCPVMSIVAVLLHLIWKAVEYSVICTIVQLFLYSWIFELFSFFSFYKQCCKENSHS